VSAATVAAQARADKRRGAMLLRRFANAVATFDTTSTAEVLFERLSDRATLGGLQVAGRDITIEAITAELPDFVRDGWCLKVAMGDAPDIELGPFRVRRGGRVDDLEDGTTLLQLEAA
jgi:hypothetical protein